MCSLPYGKEKKNTKQTKKKIKKKNRKKQQQKGKKTRKEIGFRLVYSTTPLWCQLIYRPLSYTEQDVMVPNLFRLL